MFHVALYLRQFI